MKKSMFVCLLILTCTVLFGESDVNVEYNKDAVFSKYMRYAWKKGTNAARPDVHQFILGAVDRELQFKGRTPDSRSPNFYVTYFGSSEKEFTVESFGYTLGDVGSSELKVMPVQVGTLVIDLIDAADGKRVWRGSAVGALSASGNVENLVRTKVAEMFKKFPPKRQ